MCRRAAKLLSGQLDDLAAEYIYPLPLDLGRHRVIVRNADEGRAMLGLLRSAMIDRGVVQLRAQLKAMDIVRGGRMRVWVDWHECALSEEESRRSSALYYCRVTPYGLRTEMVAYTRLSMPELNPQFAALALTA